MSDWIVLTFVGPFLIAGCSLVVVTLWRVPRQPKRAAGDEIGNDTGYPAFLGPATVSMFAGWLGTVAQKVQDAKDTPSDQLDVFIGVCFAVCMAFLLLGFWLWMTRWPRFLVPPRFRRER